MTGLIIGIGIAAVAIVISILTTVIVNRKQDRILNEMSRDDATVQSKCMVREGAIHAPGVVQVIDDTLIIKTVLGRTFELPLDEVELRKETIGIGWHPWWGKAVFKLKAPQTTMLAIGVSRKQAGAWREVFE